MVQMHSLSNTLISSASTVPIPSPLRSSLGALDLPAVPMNMILEAAMLPNADKVAARIQQLIEG